MRRTGNDDTSRAIVNRQRRILSAVIGMMSLAWAFTANAVVVYSTGFEAPTFTAGQPIATQDGWVSRFGSPAGSVSTNFPRSGQQSLEIKFDQLPEFCCDFNLETVRRFLDYDAVANGFGAVRVAVDMRLNGPSLADYLVVAIFSAIDPSFQYYGEMQISADGHLYVYGSRPEDFYMGDVTFGQYHRLAMTIDFLSRETAFEIDDIQLATFVFDPNLQSNIFGAGLLSGGTPTDPLVADPTLYSAYFDNFVVESIPEPSTSALFVLSLVIIVMRMQKKASKP